MSLLWIQVISAYGFGESVPRVAPADCPHCGDHSAHRPDSHGLSIRSEDDESIRDRRNCGCPEAFEHARLEATTADGEHAGSIEYGYHPDGSAVTIDMMQTPGHMRGRGHNTTLMNHLWSAHPHALVHYTGFTPEGQAWHDSYEDKEPDPGRVVEGPDDPRWHDHFGKGADRHLDDVFPDPDEGCSRCNGPDPGPYASHNHTCLYAGKR